MLTQSLESAALAEPLNPAAIALATRAGGVRSPLLVALWLTSAFGRKLAKLKLRRGQKYT
eukprot:2212559-Heterocapsa_arctica.AAC.1